MKHHREESDTVVTNPCLALPEELAMVILVMGSKSACAISGGYCGFVHRIGELRTVSRTWTTIIRRNIMAYRGLIDESWSFPWLIPHAVASGSLSVRTHDTYPSVLIQRLATEATTTLRTLCLTFHVDPRKGAFLTPADIRSLRSMTQLTALTLRGSRWLIDHCTIEQLHGLTSLNLSDCGLQSLRLTRLSRLVSLSFYNVSATIVGLARATQLTELCTNNQDSSDAVAATLPRLTNLTKLKMQSHVVHGPDIARLSQLRVLSLDYVKSGITDSHLTQLSGLRSLALKGPSAISDAGAAKLISLRELNLDSNGRIGDTGLVNLTGLTSLNLRSARGAITDASVSCLTALTKLNLGDCFTVTDEALSRLTALRWLCLWGRSDEYSPITDTGLTPLTALTHLAIDSPGVTASCILSLTNLTFLDVIGCDGLYCGDARLERHLPRLCATAYDPVIRPSNPIGYPENLRR